ncbi:MAG: CpaF family protein [Anaerolineae bacterium]|nr:CpaF family protein [Anaerolineae bacterium]
MSLLKRIEGTQPEEKVSRLEELRARQPAAVTQTEETYRDLKSRIQERLVAEMDEKLDISRREDVRRAIEELFNSILAQENIILSRTERHRMFEQIVADIIGYGPIEPFLADPSINEIMVNGPNAVYIERRGRIEKTAVRFQDDEHLLRIIDRIVAPLGRRVDEASPYVDARLPDGSRVNAIIPPLALNGPVLTIRKFAKIPITAENLVEYGTLTQEALDFLKACVLGRLNILISGGTGSGKTTTLNVLSAYIPNDERIITIENAAELQLRQEHVVTLESRPPNIEGKGEVTIRDLVINSLRMRPDRIIVGEVRGAEALDMLQAMNTGHDGSMTTLHANSPRDALSRLETMVLMAGMDLPHRAIREQIASAIDLIVHQERMRDGVRRVVSIVEVVGMEGDTIVMQDIFRFQQVGVEDGKVIGRLRPTGIRPKFMEKLEAANIRVASDTFGAMKKNS